MADSFENEDNILRDWAKDKVKKSRPEALNRFEKPEEERQSRFFRKMIEKKFSSSLSRQSSETKHQNISGTRGYASCATFCSYHILTSYVITEQTLGNMESIC